MPFPVEGLQLLKKALKALMFILPLQGEPFLHFSHRESAMIGTWQPQSNSASSV